MLDSIDEISSFRKEAQLRNIWPLRCPARSKSLSLLSYLTPRTQVFRSFLWHYRLAVIYCHWVHKSRPPKGVATKFYTMVSNILRPSHFGAWNPYVAYIFLYDMCTLCTVFVQGVQCHALSWWLYIYTHKIDCTHFRWFLVVILSFEMRGCQCRVAADVTMSACHTVSLRKYPANAGLVYRKAHVTVVLSAARLVGCCLCLWAVLKF